MEVQPVRARSLDHLTVADQFHNAVDGRGNAQHQRSAERNFVAHDRSAFSALSCHGSVVYSHCLPEQHSLCQIAGQRLRFESPQLEVYKSTSYVKNFIDLTLKGQVSSPGCRRQI